MVIMIHWWGACCQGLGDPAPHIFSGNHPSLRFAEAICLKVEKQMLQPGFSCQERNVKMSNVLGTRHRVGGARPWRMTNGAGTLRDSGPSQWHPHPILSLSLLHSGRIDPVLQVEDSGFPLLLSRITLSPLNVIARPASPSHVITDVSIECVQTNRSCFSGSECLRVVPGNAPLLFKSQWSQSGWYPAVVYTGRA